MKKQDFIIIVMAATVSMSLMACGDDEKEGDDASKETSHSDVDTDTHVGDEPDEVISELTRDTEPAVADDDYQAYIFGTNDFGFDLFHQFAASEKNVFFSGLSISIALGMNAAGARASTAQEMADVLHNSLLDDAFHGSANKMALELDGRNIAPHETSVGEKNLQLSLVNALWAQQNYTIETPFLDTLALNYASGIKLLDFVSNAEGSRLIINDWVADQTNNRIEDLIPEGIITADTRLVLTNALYFYGSWNRIFEEANTDDGTFTTLANQEVTVSMMHQTTTFPYAEGDGYQMVDLPYDGGEISMSIVLPEAGRFTEIRSLLSNTWLEEARASISPVEVQLSLPKFSFTWGSEKLKGPLVELGMVDAFQFGVADFTGINTSKELFIAEVVHKAFIGVDEHGTEAAAATAVVDWAGSAPSEPVSFTVDRPFLLFIRDASGILLFTGQVVDPS